MDIALIALIIYLIATAADKVERRKRRQQREMRRGGSTPPSPPESRREGDQTWREIWAEVKKAISEETTPAIERGRRRRKARRAQKAQRQTPPPTPASKMVPHSTDTAISMRHYHSTLRPSEYILRRKQEEQSRLRPSTRAKREEETLGRRLFEGDVEERRETLRDALLRAEILRSRWRS